MNFKFRNSLICLFSEVLLILLHNLQLLESDFVEGRLVLLAENVANLLVDVHICKFIVFSHLLLLLTLIVVIVIPFAHFIVAESTTVHRQVLREILS